VGLKFKVQVLKFKFGIEGLTVFTGQIFQQCSILFLYQFTYGFKHAMITKEEDKLKPFLKFWGTKKAEFSAPLLC
jgi:hypothetical protein